MLKYRILCPCCGEGSAFLKFDDNLFFYECDFCGSDFADIECSKVNKENGKYSKEMLQSELQPR